MTGSMTFIVGRRSGLAGRKQRSIRELRHRALGSTVTGFDGVMHFVPHLTAYSVVSMSGRPRELAPTITLIFSQQHELSHYDVGVAPCEMGAAVRPVNRLGESD